MQLLPPTLVGSSGSLVLKDFEDSPIVVQQLKGHQWMHKNDGPANEK